MKTPITFPEPFVFVGDTVSPPGSAQWQEDFTTLGFMCPCGCNRYIHLPLKPKHENGWSWDGHRDRPSITPSIENTPCNWHGYLVSGEWVSV